MLSWIGRATTTVALAMFLSVAASQRADALLERMGIDPSRTAVPLDGILSGGPPPQGIPAIGFSGVESLGIPSTHPAKYETVSEAAEWLEPEEPVVLVEVGGQARAYPLQVLTWHEIANDTLGGLPIAVTFCPLCNSALAFDRRVPVSKAQSEEVLARDAKAIVTAPTADYLAQLETQGLGGAVDATVTVTFGVSGLLIGSNLLMFDSSTFTIWSQIVGDAAVGTLVDTTLLRYPAPIVSFETFAKAHPDATVLSRNTGFTRAYGTNPYIGYDRADSPPFLYQGALDGRLPPKARVVTLAGDPPLAIPFDLMAEQHVVHEEVEGRGVVAFWQAGTRSALDGRRIAESADVGAVGVFFTDVDGRSLNFWWSGDAILDRETNSTWNVLGVAESGPLAGTELQPALHTETLWFSWAAFRPDTRVVEVGP